MDLAFEQLLAEHNQVFKEAEVYSNWMPPDAEYIVSLIKLETGIKEKDQVKTSWWKLTGRIEDVQDAKLNGKEFCVGFYRSTAYGILKGDARILSSNPHLNDLAEAHIVLEEAARGVIVRVNVKTSYSEKYKKDFTNCYIQEVINTTTEASVEEMPTTTAKDGIYTGESAPSETPSVIVDEAGTPLAPVETEVDGVSTEAPVVIE